MPTPDDVRLVLRAAVLTCTAVAVVVLGGGVVLAAAGAVLAVGVVLLFVRQVVRHRRLARGLLAVTWPARLAGLPVRLGPLDGAAFAAGLGRPVIFCDERLTATLTDAELEAVMQHECAHQVARDPLRTAALAAVAPILRPFPSGAAWMERLAARREIAADRFALAQGASRAAIASALLKVDRLAPAAVPGFAPAATLRLRALLGDEPDVSPPRGRRAGLLTAGAVIAGAACLLLLHPWVTTSAAACC